MRDSAAAFGLRFRAQRERRGLTIGDVAAATKIKGSLLAALEQGDLSRWPKGIYGRAFLRACVDAIGMPADALPDELLQGVTADVIPAAAEPSARPALRLTLAADVPRSRWTPASTLDAMMTLAGVLVVAAVIAGATGVSFVHAAAVVALVWYPVAHARFGGFSPLRLAAKYRRGGPGYLPDEAAADPERFGEYQVSN